MAMNKQRRSSNIANIFSYDDAGNIVIKDYGQVTRYSWNGLIHGFVGPLSVSFVSAATTDTDRFLVSDGGVLKYRTGSEVLSDIGGVPSTRTLTINGTSYDLSVDRSWTIPSANIYNSDGSLTGNRVVTMGGSSLQFTGSDFISRVFSTGRLSINRATSPLGILHIQKPVNSSEGHIFLSTPYPSTTPTSIIFQNNDFAGTGAGTGTFSWNTGGDGFIFSHRVTVNTGDVSVSAGNAIVPVGYGYYFGSGEYIKHSGSGTWNIDFVTNSTQRMRLTNAGRLLLGTVSESTFLLDVNGTARVSGEFRMKSNQMTWGTDFVSNSIVLYDGGSSTNRIGIGVTSAGGLGLFSRVNSLWLSATNDAASMSASNAQIQITNTVIQGIVPFVKNSVGNAFIYDGGVTTNRYGIGVSSDGTQIFSGSLNPSIVFGIGYDSSNLTKSTATMWMSATGLIIGSGTDAGYKLDVNGTARVSGDMTVNGITVGRGTGNLASNSAFGVDALKKNTTGTNNTGLGISALSENLTGSFNTSIGALSMYLMTGGTNNSAVGYHALSSSTTSNYNTALGNEALRALNTDDNTGIGFYALRYVVTGGGNTALGSNAGRQISGGSANLTSSSNSVFIGLNSKALADSQTNQIVIGYQATGLGSNTTTIGNSSTITTALRGRLILGTLSDSGLYQLDVNGTARVSGQLTVVNSGGTGTTGINISSGNNTFALAINSNAFVTPYGNQIHLRPTGIGGIVMTNNAYNALEFSPGYGGNNAFLRNNLTVGAIIGIGGNITVEASAMLNVISTTQGFLPPRMTTTQKNAIATPAAGLVVYDNTDNYLSLYNGTNWQNIVSPNSAGNVLIGTLLDGGQKFQVDGTSNFSNKLSVIATAITNDVALFRSVEPYITIEAVGGSNPASIFFRPSTSAQNATIQNRTGGGIDLYTGITPSLSLAVKSSGAVVASSTLGLNGVEDSVKSGKYTPTLTNSTNVASSAVNDNVFKYIRVGSTVHVSGWVTITATASNTLTELELSLPIASNITSNEDVSGVANTLSGGYGQVRENATNNTAKMYVQPTSTGNLVWYLEFSYVII